jgi:hypothetical protein
MTALGAGHVEAVRRLFETGRAFLRGDRRAFETAVREICDPEVLVVPSSALASGNMGPFRGHDGVLSNQAAVADRWGDFDLIADDYVEASSNTVVLLGKIRARGDDGSGYAVEVGIVNRFEDGRIVSIQSYQSRQRALEEAGARLVDRARPHEQP